MSGRLVLCHRVECKDSIRPWYEPIAAFNNEEVAKSYATDCHATNREFSYRVMTLRGRAWVEVLKLEG